MSVDGRICDYPPIGASLNGQENLRAHVRFPLGLRHHAHLVPPETHGELEILRDAACRVTLDNL